MRIIVTGSIAYDYLMSYPGTFTEHFLPDHLSRVSLSFLVDTMDKRRGGCAPNIAYSLALLNERPVLMGTAGQDFGDREVLVVFQGQHGYVSPSWYEPGSVKAPTWNFSAVHCHGTPEILDADTNLAVLTKLVAHFEQPVEEPMWLNQGWAPPIARGTVGLRIPVDRFTCKVKMSQDKDPVTVQNVIAQLRAPGPYNQPHLADDMERARNDRIGYPSAT